VTFSTPTHDLQNGGSAYPEALFGGEYGAKPKEAKRVAFHHGNADGGFKRRFDAGGQDVRSIPYGGFGANQMT